MTLNDAKHKLCDTQPFESTTRQKAICYNEDKMAQKFNIVPTAKHKRTLTTAKRCVYRDLRCLNLISSQIIFVRLSNRQKGSLEVSLATGEMRLISPGQNAQVWWTSHTDSQTHARKPASIQSCKPRNHYQRVTSGENLCFPIILASDPIFRPNRFFTYYYT